VGAGAGGEEGKRGGGKGEESRREGERRREKALLFQLR